MSQFVLDDQLDVQIIVPALEAVDNGRSIATATPYGTYLG